MNKDQTSSAQAQFTEAPASWNTLYITPEGFSCQLTLRAETGQDVIEKAQAALAFLANQGCRPKGSKRRSSKRKDTRWCPIHNCEMRRWEKNGKVWYSHKVNGEWCKGK